MLIVVIEKINEPAMLKCEIKIGLDERRKIEVKLFPKKVSLRN